MADCTIWMQVMHYQRFWKTSPTPPCEERWKSTPLCFEITDNNAPLRAVSSYLVCQGKLLFQMWFFVENNSFYNVFSAPQLLKTLWYVSWWVLTWQPHSRPFLPRGYFVFLYMKGCIWHFTKLEIHTHLRIQRDDLRCRDIGLYRKWLCHTCSG